MYTYLLVRVYLHTRCRAGNIAGHPIKMYIRSTVDEKKRTTLRQIDFFSRGHEMTEQWLLLCLVLSLLVAALLCPGIPVLGATSKNVFIVLGHNHMLTST